MATWRGGQTRGVHELAAVKAGTWTVVLRRAEARDLPALVDLLAADQLGATRDGVRTPEDLAAYQRASSPPTSHAPMPAVFTSGSASWPRTRG